VYYGEGGWPTGSIDTDMYIQFTLTPNAGYTLNLTSVDLNMRRSTTGSPAGAGPRQWSLRSSMDGYSADLGSGTLSQNSSPTTSISLSTSFQNVMTPITFRLYGYDVFNNAGGLNRFVFDNIAVRGLMLLPIHFTSLTGKVSQEKNALLYWAVDGNSTVNYFEVERSDNGTNFFATDKISKQQTASYSYTDKRVVTGLHVWYRIKSVEINGTISYSDILKLQVQQNGALSINKIVTNGSKIIAQVNAPVNGTIQIMLTTMDGKIIARQNYSVSKGSQAVQLNRNNIPGIQVLSIVMNDLLMSRQFVN